MSKIEIFLGILISVAGGLIVAYMAGDNPFGRFISGEEKDKPLSITPLYHQPATDNHVLSTSSESIHPINQSSTTEPEHPEPSKTGYPVRPVSPANSASENSSSLKQEAQRQLDLLVRSRSSSQGWAFNPAWSGYMERQHVAIYYIQQRQRDAAELVYRLTLLGAEVHHELVSEQDAAYHGGEIDYTYGRRNSAQIIRAAVADIQQMDVIDSDNNNQTISVWLN